MEGAVHPAHPEGPAVPPGGLRDVAPEPPLRRASTGDRVREILLERILGGGYEPGDRIVESRVARELETSQAPVREAIRELQGFGLVTVKPYCGAFVREVDEAEMVEAAEVRSVLEGFAARRAGPRLRDAGSDLDANLEGMRGAARHGDLQAFGDHDLAFHRRIVESSGQATLLRTWESLGVGVRIRMLLERTGADLPGVAEAHAPIAAACARGDDTAAANLLERHPRVVYAQVGRPWPGDPDAA